MLARSIRVEEIGPRSVAPGAAAIGPCPSSLVCFKGLSSSYPDCLPSVDVSPDEIVSLLIWDGGKMAAMVPLALLLSSNPSVLILAEEVALASLLFPPVLTF